MVMGGEGLVKGGEGRGGEERGGQMLATLLGKVHLAYSGSLEKQGGINHTVDRKEFWFLKNKSHSTPGLQLPELLVNPSRLSQIAPPLRTGVNYTGRQVQLSHTAS